MEFIKQSFSIKDLEKLSGIKAHTIRIWEKRYNILSPDRTSTNIRSYDNSNLQKILNVAFLNENGYKISRISKLSDEEINNMVRNITTSKGDEDRAINSFKLSMLNFDEELFNNTYNDLKESKTFREIFHEVFLPFLDEIGVLWQTSTIKPIHAHYIVELIKQKIYLNIAALKEKDESSGDELYVLFLPDNEIHDVGILYLYFELLYNNHRAIYLGPSLPLEDIKYLLELHDNTIFVSYITTKPDDITEFFDEYQREICEDKQRKLILLGQKTKGIEDSQLPDMVHVYKSIMPFIKSLT